jgi:hypothetical protein
MGAVMLMVVVMVVMIAGIRVCTGTIMMGLLPENRMSAF